MVEGGVPTYYNIRLGKKVLLATKIAHLCRCKMHLIMPILKFKSIKSIYTHKGKKREGGSSRSEAHLDDPLIVFGTL